MADPTPPGARPPDSTWTDPDHVLAYLAVADDIPHRAEGEGVLLGEVLPERCDRVLDLGTGDGRLLALVRGARPGVRGIAVDLSPPMMAAFRQRFADVPDAEVTLVEHDLNDPLPPAVVAGAPYDAVVSSFAIHHTPHERKRSLFAEVFDLLRPGGVFANLEHVASPTDALHEQFMAAIGEVGDPEDPANILAPVEDQLVWLRVCGFDDVECLWKWRELALLVGTRPG